MNIQPYRDLLLTLSPKRTKVRLRIVVSAFPSPTQSKSTQSTIHPHLDITQHPPPPSPLPQAPIMGDCGSLPIHSALKGRIQFHSPLPSSASPIPIQYYPNLRLPLAPLAFCFRLQLDRSQLPSQNTERILAAQVISTTPYGEEGGYSFLVAPVHKLPVNLEPSKKRDSTHQTMVERVRELYPRAKSS